MKQTQQQKARNACDLRQRQSEGFGKGRATEFPAPRNFDKVFWKLGKNCM